MTTLCDIGYERASLDDVIAALKNARVQILLDVRELPNSRRAGFSKRQLMAGLAEAGIAYRHMKALGTPKAGRDAAKRGDTKTMQQIFKAKLETPEAQLALVEAAEIAKAERACLLCLEHDWRVCHRAIVSERLERAYKFKPAHLAAGAA